MRLSAHIVAIAALAAGAVLSFIVALVMVTQIERSSLEQVNRALLVAGEEWATVTVDGLLMTMTGTAPDEATRFRALRVAGGVVDGSRIIDAMEVKAAEEIAPPRFSIEILRNTAGVSLIGLVPGDMNRAEVTADVSARTNGGPVADLLETAAHPAPLGWEAALDFALDTLERLPRSKISVAAERVEITAVAENGPAKRLLESSLRREAPSSLQLELNITAPRPVISPFTLRFVLDAETGGRFDACSAHTEQGRARIVATAAEAGLAGRASCVLGLGVPSPRWADAVTLGIEAVSELGGGSVTLSDVDISLQAPETVPDEEFDRVVGRLENRLPDIFSLTATKPNPPEIVGTGEEPDDGPPEFVATLSPEGLLQLRGRVKSERARSAVAGFALALFSGNDVQPSMRLDERLPDGWAARVFAGLDALALLKNGSLVVQPEFIDIRGSTGQEDARAEISRILTAQLGEAANFSVAVNYVETLDPTVEDETPTPEECVEVINTIIAARKITFEPGSAEVDAAGLATIDQISEVMENCADAPMEIAGHTDSQGREVMNQALSQQRAEAVLVALQVRRVLTGNLTPKGYGEANPIADNGTEEGREANRRIEFTLITESSDTEPAPEDGADESSGDDQ